MVKLVEYADSSDDERDDERDDNQWSSLSLSPPSPSDSLSYPMRSPDSEDDEDYAPSETSLESPDSDTQSVDTDDLDPHEEMGDETEEDNIEQEEDVIDLTQQQEDVFDEWTELQEDNPFKRRNVDTCDGHSNCFDVEDGSWTTNPSPKDQFFSRESATIKSSDEKETNTTTAFAFKVPTVEIPATKTQSFTFGTGSDDTRMRSPTPRHAPATAFAVGEGGFTIGRSGKAPKPYNFAGRGASGETASKVATTVDEGDDTLMRSPSPQVKPAATPTNAEFLFGQGYKNRKAFVIPRQKSDEACHQATANVAPARAKESSWAAKIPDAGTSTGRFGTNCEPTVASAAFTTGIPGPHRNADRRKKKPSSVFTAAQAKNNSSIPTFETPSPAASFGSTLFQTATATNRRPETSFIHPVVSASPMEDHVHVNGARTTQPAVPSSGCTGGSYIFGSSSTKSSTGANPSPFGTSNSGSAPATSTAGTSAQFLFGNGTSHEPFEFGDAETDSQPVRAGSHFAGTPTGSAAFGSFNIGSAEAKKNSRFTSRVRPRKSGMFANKNSPGKGAKFGEGEPEPSPGATSSTSTSQSPFGMHNRRGRKNARLRHTYGRSPPADPFVTPTFHNHPSSNPFVSSEGNHNPNVVRPIAKKGIPFTFGASDNNITAAAAQMPSTSSEPGASFFQPQQQQQTTISQSQDSNHRSSLQPNGPAQQTRSQQPNEGGTRPAFAGSRRILRAALRGVGVRGDRASSAPLTTANYRSEEGDAEMDSEDERDWMELKRLGGVAYTSKQYEEAAEYYRQSIEVLESQLNHDVGSDTAELRTDKAKLHANRAASLMNLTQINEALQECQRSIEVDATYARAYLRLSRIQVLLGKTAHAQANLDTAKQLMEGHSIRNQADHDSLIKMEAAIRDLTMLQGEIKWYMDCGDFKQALEPTESALELAPSCRKLQVQKASILLHQKEFDEIVKFCISIVEKHLTSPGKPSPASRTKPLKDKTVGKVVGIDLGLLWATSLHYQNKVDDALSVLNDLEAVALCSSNVVQLKRQWEDMKQLKSDGNDKFKRGEYQEAVRLYSEAVQIDPQHHEYCAVVYCNRAAAQMALERYHTAILDCNEALQRKPQYARALLRRARCHVALKMFHEAVKDFDNYLREQHMTTEATADVRHERNEAKAAIARAREEARQREAAKKRAEREQRQRRSQRSEEQSWDYNTFYENFRRSANSNRDSNNGSRYGSRYQSSGAGGRASFMAPKTQRRTHYDVLGIEIKASGDQIKKAYRKLALVYHPDKAKTSTHADLFKEMTAAYNVLSDTGARAKYDRGLVYNRFGNFYEN